MAHALQHPTDIRPLVSDAEWQVRIDLAAAYRLVAYYGWSDLIFTHLSARVPGPEHHFLINPYGMMFDEVRASDLVKIDLDGNIVLSEWLRRESGGLLYSQRNSHGTRRCKSGNAFTHRRRGRRVLHG